MAALSTLLAPLLCLTGCAIGPASAPPGVVPSPAVRPEALSLLGQPLYRPALPPAREAMLHAQLDSATARFTADPGDPDALLWLGRRLAYLGRYREAIAAYTRGIRIHPNDPRFYRHRGHRYITSRQFDLAIADLQTAAALTDGQPDQLEPDGQPNAAGLPLSTLQGNIFYHLALAHYLRHEFERAVPLWLRARALARNDDMIVATSDWLYMTYRRLGREREAADVLRRITTDLRVIENQAYLQRLRLYRGELTPKALLESAGDDPTELATYRYGVANWYLYNGDRTRAEEMLRTILQGPNWAAFGYIAAETELGDGR